MPAYRSLLIIACLLCFGMTTPGVNAQQVGVLQSGILVLDTEGLFEQTLLGQRMSADLQEKREQLIARNRELEAELEAEERALTGLRSEKTPEEFRELADTFDDKVQKIRQQSENAVRALERNRERAPVIFMRTVEPVLVEIMRESRGVIVMDIRSVLLRADVIDITPLAIARINAVIGKGPDGPMPLETPNLPDAE